MTTLADCGDAGTVTVEHDDPIRGGRAERVRRGLANERGHLTRFIAPWARRAGMARAGK